jgi:site-specific DNA-methyltransferase (adenine-specific)
MTDPNATIHHGDCRNIIADLPDCSVDSIVTDPPYELGFMGKAWDGSGIAYDPTLWAECLRVLKPGGHLLAFGGTRTYHRMTVAIEDAGFEIRDSIHWLYGSGFPKSLDVSKAIDKAAGAEREVIGQTRRGAQSSPTNAYGAWGDGITETAPATDAARQWEGWGTALKPAHEPIVVARRPLSGTVAATVLEHGTGALNIDGCRVDYASQTDKERMSTGVEGIRARGGVIEGSWKNSSDLSGANPANTAGRWPANLILTHSADCATACVTDCPVAEIDRQSGERPGGAFPDGGKRSKDGDNALGWFAGNAQPARSMGDTGGASRFFTVTEWDPTADAAPFRYVAKPSRAERNAGLDELPQVVGKRTQDGGDDTRGRPTPVNQNHHPTVKPLALMRWLVRLVTPPGGTVLEPFAGSGTTMAAAILEDRHVIGCELTADYLPIIQGRIAWAYQQRNQTLATLFDEEPQ